LKPSPPPGPSPENRELATASDTAAAVQAALGTEHAAVWCYGLLVAFLPPALDRLARQDATAHRARRDFISRTLADAGVPPIAAEPGYRTPNTVVDQASAIHLAISAEADAAAAWRSVLERCDDPALRRVALEGLTDAAVRGAQWAARSETAPVVPTFPGRT